MNIYEHNMILLIACFFSKAYELVEIEWGHFAGYSEKNELLCLKIDILQIAVSPCEHDDLPVDFSECSLSS